MQSGNLSGAVGAGSPDTVLGEAEVRDICARALSNLPLSGKRVLLIVPDHTRTAPVGLLFRAVYDAIGEQTTACDVMVALGTHPPLSEEAVCRRLEITLEERQTRYGRVRFLNHAWNNPEELAPVGVIDRETVARLTEGRFSMEVPVEVNRRVLEYDHLVLIGPVFPHEVAGFSGGNKYLFPGVSGPQVLNFFHWLGAVASNPKIIGHKRTVVRAVIDYAASLVPVARTAVCMVVRPGDAKLSGLWVGETNAAWEQASDLSARVHVVYKEKPFHTVLSCAPPMYDDIWVAGKCMYKLEPVVADGGELIIYAPHVSEVSHTHHAVLSRVGYHTRDYFLAQWEKFQSEPWGVLAHSTHVKGIGAYENGVERPRVTVTLATAIPETVCRTINLGYRDPASINPADFANREKEGVLLVPKAGEMLYRLQNPPEWARV